MFRLPLFILPTVLFPGALLPLHVFEPRYRRMVARCLEGDRRFGVLYHDSDTGPFELREGAIGCVAEIVEFRPLPDGRSLMATRGAERFRVLDGIESQTEYVEALVESSPDGPTDPARIPLRRRHTIELFRAAAAAVGRGANQVPGIDPGEDVSWQVAQAFRIDEAWRQHLLELDTEAGRLDEVDRLLQTVIESGT